MVDNNYNMIKPVEALQNITGLTPVNQRKERKPQEKQKQNRQQKRQQIQDESLEIDAENETTAKQEQTDPNSIDFCA